jgi:hypothetical protein
MKTAISSKLSTDSVLVPNLKIHHTDLNEIEFKQGDELKNRFEQFITTPTCVTSIYVTKKKLFAAEAFPFVTKVYTWTSGLFKQSLPYQVEHLLEMPDNRILLIES